MSDDTNSGSYVAALEQQNANLTSLYVASYQLHGTLDREAVVMAMQEIIVNLVGSEHFAVYELDRAGSRFELVASVGEDRRPEFESGPVAEAIRSGEIRIGATGAPVAACVPLKRDGMVTGVVVIHGLLPHKNAIEPLDHELFDLLATQAATALYCTSLHAAASAERRDA
jgi:nitrate/nitrite-specific signal transduction histidine kinase